MTNQFDGARLYQDYGQTVEPLRPAGDPVIYEYLRRPAVAQQANRRVPRAWWGWLPKLWRWLRRHKDAIHDYGGVLLIGGGCLGIFGLLALMVGG